MQIELYINKQLCDIENPKNFSIFLKRQFLNPAELNTKDAQKSYSIKLPTTTRNNDIFNHINVEEVGNKFRIYPNAKLYVGGVLILDGKFRLSEISRNEYKGNLGVPAPITVKNVFGETFMNQAGKWLIPFRGLADLTSYNNKQDSEVIFPLVLYGLLPKYVENDNYTSKDVYDDSVRLSLNDFPPSINAIQALQKIFENANYNLSGTAVNDERLKNLYVSYKNSNDYELQWGLGKMEISGNWKMLKNGIFDKNNVIISDDNINAYVNLFKSSTTTITRNINNDGNAINRNRNINLKIPVTGLYKIVFDVELDFNKEATWFDDMHAIEFGDMDYSKTEIKIIRNNSNRNITTDDVYFNNNQKYNEDVDGAIYPQWGGVHFIDPKQNSGFICGFSFGKYDGEEELKKNYNNPADNIGLHCSMMAISGGISWDNETSYRVLSAVNNETGYKKRAGDNFTFTDNFIIELQNADNTITKRSNKQGIGKIHQVIWLEKDDELELYVSSALHPVTANNITYHQIPNTHYNFNLSIEPFTPYKSWLKVDSIGKSTEPMDWNDPIVFEEGEIDLVKFLPSQIKVNDWIDNFCKAFNLRLENVGPNQFELNIKNTELINRTSNIIDLDNKASIALRTSQPLGVPYMYDIGFSIDTNEEGYIQDMEIDETTGERILNTGTTGGGQFYTGTYETNTIQQTSTFSYNWFKQLYDRDGNELIKVPIITEHDIWENDYNYNEVAGERYYDKSQRFWFKDGVIELVLSPNNIAEIAIVSNKYTGRKNLILDYENKQDSIMRTYFLLFTNNNNYNLIECYLTPEEYSNLGIAVVRFNGDIYNVAEVDGFDPLNRRKATLKLIRKLL